MEIIIFYCNIIVLMIMIARSIYDRKIDPDQFLASKFKLGITKILEKDLRKEENIVIVDQKMDDVKSLCAGIS